MKKAILDLFPRGRLVYDTRVANTIPFSPAQTRGSESMIAAMHGPKVPIPETGESSGNSGV